MSEPILLPVIAGPTASGKTELAVSLAKRLNGEVISADSMQIYADLRIGTARPDDGEMQGIPHHLMGFLPLSEPYSVARYVADAGAVIREVCSRGRQPILCGGTGLYIQSLIENITFTEQAAADPAFREQLRRIAEQQGGQVLWDRLNAQDPVTAARLHPNDHGRLIRALEMIHTTGMTIEEQNRRSRRQPSPYKALILMPAFRDREHLYRRIDDRVDRMMEQGLLEEARMILAKPEAPTALQAIGYKELAPYLAGTVSLEEAVSRIKQGTRHYAKRQLSWFRRMEVHALYREDYAAAEELTEAAVTRWREFVKGESDR